MVVVEVAEVAEAAAPVELPQTWAETESKKPMDSRS